MRQCAQYCTVITHPHSRPNQPCIRSPAHFAPLRQTLVNDLDKPLYAFWVDFMGKETFLQSVPEGGVTEQVSSVGHAWRLRGEPDSTSTLVKEWRAFCGIISLIAFLQASVLPACLPACARIHTPSTPAHTRSHPSPIPNSAHTLLPVYVTHRHPGCSAKPNAGFHQPLCWFCRSLHFPAASRAPRHLGICRQATAPPRPTPGCLVGVQAPAVAFRCPVPRIPRCLPTARR